MSARKGLVSRVLRLAIGIGFAGSVAAPVRAQPLDEPSSEKPSPSVRGEDRSAADSSATPAGSNAGAKRAERAPSEASLHDDPAHPEDPRTQASEQNQHVAPPRPSHLMGPMPAQEMTRVMEMDDAAPLAMLKFDRLEYRDGDGAAAGSWKFLAWAGGDLDKVQLRSEGEHARGRFDHADAEILWDHAAASFWDTQLGVRHDFGVGPDRNWAAFGVQGLAPYWLGIEATAYVGDAGRTALRVEVDYELSLTQRLILQPRFEFNAYAKADPAARIGAGVSDAEVGLRLRYEIRREIAPYMGIEHVRRFGATASLVERDGMDAGETRWVAGVRIWY